MSTPTMTGPHGIDLTAPGGIDRLLDFHRSTFGSVTMSTAAPETTPPGTATPPAPAAPPAGPPSPADVAARLRDQGTTTPPETPPAPADGDIDALPEWAQKIIRDTRADAAAANGRARDTARAEAAEAARAEVLEQITRALGGDPSSDSTPSVEDLTGQVATLTGERDTLSTELRDARTALAVYLRAGQHRADAAGLIDSRTFLSSLSDIDPSDVSAIDEKIRDFVKDHPRYLARAAGASSVDHPGGSGESTDPASSAAPGMGRLRAAYGSTSTT